MKKIIAGNWKMHGSAAMVQALTPAVVQAAAGAKAKVVICPPAVLLAEVARALSGSNVALGGQDCHSEPQGPFTGDTGAPMLKEAGCSYVIVGHSERRAAYGETDVAIRGKASCAIAAGLIPIICVGETGAQRDAGQAEAVVAAQVANVLPQEVMIGSRPSPGRQADFVLAYEPVWAIGSGKVATPDDIARMHAYISEQAARHTRLSPSQVAVLYGGSVNAANAQAILALPGVSGVLVGGASVKAEEFIAILRAA